MAPLQSGGQLGRGRRRLLRHGERRAGTRHVHTLTVYGGRGDVTFRGTLDGPRKEVAISLRSARVNWISVMRIVGRGSNIVAWYDYIAASHVNS